MSILVTESILFVSETTDHCRAVTGPEVTARIGGLSLVTRDMPNATQAQLPGAVWAARRRTRQASRAQRCRRDVDADADADAAQRYAASLALFCICTPPSLSARSSRGGEGRRHPQTLGRADAPSSYHLVVRAWRSRTPQICDWARDFLHAHPSPRPMAQSQAPGARVSHVYLPAPLVPVAGKGSHGSWTFASRSTRCLPSHAAKVVYSTAVLMLWMNWGPRGEEWGQVNGSRTYLVRTCACAAWTELTVRHRGRSSAWYIQTDR
jgi:hypothetical protein